MKTLRVSLDLLALSQNQKAVSRDAGVPLYLPAFETALLAEPDCDDRTAEADPGVEADGLVIGYDQDDDFY